MDSGELISLRRACDNAVKEALHEFREELLALAFVFVAALREN